MLETSTDIRMHATLVELANDARASAEAALAAKDVLHKQVGANIDAELERVSAAWRDAELALQTEQLVWIRAHGSPMLQHQATEALSVGRETPFDWRPGVPLDWAQAESLAALRPQVAQEWMARHRSGWVLWDPHAASTLEPLESSGAPIDDDVPDVGQTKPLIDLMRTARAQDAGARLHQFELIEQPRDRLHFGAISNARVPGGYAPVQIALRETRQQAQQLDRFAAYLQHPHTAGRTYEETVAAFVEVETEKPLAPIPEGVVRGVLLRIDNGPKRDGATSEMSRAVLVSEDAAHLVLVDSKSLQGSVGKEVLLARGEDERVFVEAPDAPVALGYEDIDATQQLQLRRELMRLAEMERLEETAMAVASSQLREISRRVETRIDACRAVEHGVTLRNDLLAPIAPKADHVRRDSALATERLAWMVAHGSPKLARSGRQTEFENDLHAEWLRAQGGWRVKGDDERQWKRVALDGAPNTIHPARTLRDSAPIKGMMADAWTQAPEAVLVASVEAGRPVHAALIARRAPGSAVLEALVREESTKQRAQLDVIWKERLRASAERDPQRVPIPLAARIEPPEVRNEADRLVARVQREFGVPAAALPEASPIVGRLMRVEHGADHRHRAVVVNARHVHVLSVLPNAQLERLVGKSVSVEKTAGRVRIAGVALEQGLGR